MIKVMANCAAILLLSGAVLADPQVIAQDSAGIVVEVKEKYGPVWIDTCTVVMLHANNFVLVKRNAPSAWYPESFHSVRILPKE